MVVFFLVSHTSKFCWCVCVLAGFSRKIDNIHTHQQAAKNTGRILLSMEGSNMDAISCNRIQSQSPQDEGDNLVRSVFATPDLLLDILLPLIDGELRPGFFSFSTVSKSFHEATLSNQFWLQMWYKRRKGK